MKWLIGFGGLCAAGLLFGALMVAPWWVGLAAVVVWPLLFVGLAVQIATSGRQPAEPAAPKLSATVDGRAVRVEVIR